MKVVIKERTTDSNNNEYVYYVNGKKIFSYGDPEYYTDAEDMLGYIQHLLAELNIEVEIV